MLLLNVAFNFNLRPYNSAKDTAVSGGTGSGLTCGMGRGSGADAILVGAAASVAGGCEVTLVKEGGLGRGALIVNAAIDGRGACPHLSITCPHSAKMLS